jgi:Telomere resolvase
MFSGRYSYTTLGMALMALTGRRPAEIFFSAKFSLPEKKQPFPALIFEGQLKTRYAPGTSFEPYPIPVLAAPKRVLAAFDKEAGPRRIGLGRCRAPPGC